ncbi:MAG: hypothetical protein ACJASV_002984 [Pseudorhodobacter sp.]|jgi:hypothetical protein
MNRHFGPFCRFSGCLDANRANLQFEPILLKSANKQVESSLDPGAGGANEASQLTICNGARVISARCCTMWAYLRASQWA